MAKSKIKEKFRELADLATGVKDLNIPTPPGSPKGSGKPFTSVTPAGAKRATAARRRAKRLRAEAEAFQPTIVDPRSKPRFRDADGGLSAPRGEGGHSEPEYRTKGDRSAWGPEKPEIETRHTYNNPRADAALKYNTARNNRERLASLHKGAAEAEWESRATVRTDRETPRKVTANRRRERNLRGDS